MGFLDSLKRLFGSRGGSSDAGYYVYVRCDRCGDQVRVRLNLSNELQQEFSESSEAIQGYSVRKMVVDQRCFRPMEMRLRFDRSRREVGREIEGGTFLSREEFEEGTSKA